MPDYTNIKHAYIGTTNIKSIYEGSELRWQEPSVGTTLWRAVRSTEDDTLSVGDTIVIVRSNSGLFIMRNSNTKYLGYNYIRGDRPSQFRIYPLYNYNIFASDGRRLCDYVADSATLQALSYEVAEVSGEFTRLNSNGTAGQLRATSIASNNAMDIYSGNGSWFGPTIVSGRTEANLPDLGSFTSGNDTWASAHVRIGSGGNIISGAPKTVMGQTAVTWGNSTYLSTYIFKKVTAVL